MTQREALNIMKTGANVFITGPAGSGKTFVVNEYLKYLKEHGVPVGITASTGIAATHLGGMTIHSWAGIGVRNILNESDLQSLSEKSQTRKRIEAAKVLIIDEVSMLHHFRLDLVEQAVRHIKRDLRPFGGMQIILCGDFFQLPPVSRLGEPEAHFIYRSQSWRDGKFTVCYLSENHRQENDSLVGILNEIRGGDVSDDARELLRSRHVSTAAQRGEGTLRARRREHEEFPSREISVSPNPSETRSESAGIEPTRLFTHNSDADAVNEKELAKLSELEAPYEMSSRGRKPLVEALKKSCLAPEALRLKKGARIMCVKNNFEKGYVNGTLGVVVSCGYGVDPVIRTASSPDYPEGRLLTIEPASWTIEDGGKILAELSQYPLRLAWAITVHKSQGMSLDAVEVDLSKSFEPGMGYVALSRVRSLNGLSVLGINENAFQVHPEVLEYDRHLRELSARAEAVLSGTDETDLERAQKEFLATAASLHRMAKQPKLSTYEKTAVLIGEGKTLSQMAKEREMTAETIIAHIERLIADGQDMDISYLKAEISPAHFRKIEEALEEIAVGQDDGKPPLLSPIKAKVGANVSFRDIRLARVLLGYIAKNSGKSG